MGPNRKLTDLDPRFEHNILVFDCPCNRCKDLRENPNEERNKVWCDARIRIPILPEPNGWELTVGTFPETITLMPSIRIGEASKNKLGGCEGWHGHLTNGYLIACD
jgi:hypothetical protein